MKINAMNQSLFFFVFITPSGHHPNKNSSGLSPVETTGTTKCRILNQVFIFFDHHNSSFMPVGSTVGNHMRIFGRKVKQHVFANTPTLFNIACRSILPFIPVSICWEFSEGSEGVGWGFRGLHPSEPPANPQPTPRQPPGNPLGSATR